MSVVDDSRKLLQDLIAPELRAIAVRLDALEKRLDARLESAEKRLDGRIDVIERRIDGFERRVDARFDETERRAEGRHQQLMLALNQLLDLTRVKERLDRLESRGSAHQ